MLHYKRKEKGDHKKKLKKTIITVLYLPIQALGMLFFSFCYLLFILYSAFADEGFDEFQEDYLCPEYLRGSKHERDSESY